MTTMVYERSDLDDFEEVEDGESVGVQGHVDVGKELLSHESIGLDAACCLNNPVASFLCSKDKSTLHVSVSLVHFKTVSLTGICR